MVEITLREESLALTDPLLVDGLPGVGLVGKIATDYVITQRDMQYVGDVTGGELPKLAVFERQDPEIKSPVRLFADTELDLLALRSDIPISNVTIPTFASGLNRWLKELGVTPVYLSGYPGNPAPESKTTVYGVGTGPAVSDLSAAEIPPPVGSGMISGPAGAL